MELKESRSNTGREVLLAKPAPSRPPSLTVPPRNPSEVFQKSSAVTPSAMTLVSSFFAEQEPDIEAKSFSQLLAGFMASPTSQSAEGTAETCVSSSAAHGNPNGGSSAERLATRGIKQMISEGAESFGAGRSNTARFKLKTPSRLPIPRSPYLTIPSGLSPTTLLDSPVLLSTGQQAEPSPTTGTFPLPPISERSGSTAVPASNPSIAINSDQDGSSTFVFKPFPKIGRNSLSPLAKPRLLGLLHQEAFVQVPAQAHAQTSSPPSQSSAVAVSGSVTSQTRSLVSGLAHEQTSSPPIQPSAVAVSGPVTSQTRSLVPFVDAPKLGTQLQNQGPPESVLQPLTDAVEKTQPVISPAAAHLSPAHHPLLVERPSEDGFNWRKYGQKQVKGSDFPRSYYKCTHPNCPVKKKVERALDGQVTEIIYKGEHNHPKPEATRRMSMAAAHNTGREGSSMAMMAENVHIADGKNDNMSSDPSSSKKQMFNGVIGTPEPSSGSTSDDEGDGEGRKTENEDDDEPDSKRRKKEKAGDSTSILPLRTIREPRVVVQTTSDIDILDDGYRWRKYGQKIVKGNPHPRSYYKCTNLGCSVRKHVERSSTDPRAVITTYEGKHNHNVPAAKNSSHNSGGSSVAALPPPAHTGIGVSSAQTITVQPSLQDQFRIGKLLEARLKGDDKTVGLDLARGGMLSVSTSSDQHSGGHRVTNAFVPVSASMGLMDSGVNAERILHGGEYFGQGLVWRPKEEVVESHMNPGSLESAFSGSSSLAYDVAHKRELGP